MFVVSWQPHVTQPLEQSGLTVTGLEWTLQLMPPETASEQKASPLHRSGLEGTCVCLAVLVMRRELTFRGPCQVFFRWVTGWTWEPVISETPTPTGDRFEID